MYGLCGKSMRSLGLTSMLVAALAAPLTVSAATDAQAAPQSAASVPSDADLAATKCAIGEERIVPGDYYYCIAE